LKKLSAAAPGHALCLDILLSSSSKCTQGKKRAWQSPSDLQKIKSTHEFPEILENILLHMFK